MEIHKLGHCCLKIEEQGVVILTDPGAWTTLPEMAEGVDVVLITHEHLDHLHIPSLKQVLVQSPKALVITNSSVGKILNQEGIKHELLADNQNRTINGVLLEGFGDKHAQIYPSVSPVENTGYLIANRFFYPGDAFYNPGKQVEILALPVSGPWMKLAEAIDFAKKLAPKFCFPVHDGMLKFLGSVHLLPEKELKAAGINFSVIKEGESQQF
ncbi:MAG: MBL fold metallo-hydrolase [Candidatus Daviesbacteria bacterium]|nr:MBL fold metallo-hydrolase [Candidatus Daviesbacteria bacterium]